MDDLGHYDLDADVYRHLIFPDAPPDITLLPSSPLNSNIGLTSDQLAAPVLHDVIGSFICDSSLPTPPDGNLGSSSSLNSTAAAQQAFTPLIQPYHLGPEPYTAQGVMISNINRTGDQEYFEVYGEMPSRHHFPDPPLDHLGPEPYTAQGVMISNMNRTRDQEHFEVYGSQGFFHHGLMYPQNPCQGRREPKSYIECVENLIGNHRMSVENDGHVPAAGAWRNSVVGSAVGTSNSGANACPWGRSQFSASCTTETERRGGGTGPENMTARSKRERIRNMTLQDLAPYFHLPRKRAARELNLSLTTLKKVRRANGIPFWPYRKK